MIAIEPTPIQWTASVLFALAVLHTFSTRFFEYLADTQPRHAGLWHLLGEVEVVFGFWAMVLMVLMFAMTSPQEATAYLNTRNFTEPMFVFAIMVIAGTRPILQCVMGGVEWLAHWAPFNKGMARYFGVLALVPLLGSFITEPAAMTLAALMLRDTVFSRGASAPFQYATLGVLFVNISIGGTLTAFAAPPVLMVAGLWHWDTWFMLTTFGFKAAAAVVVNAGGAMLWFGHELRAMTEAPVAPTATAPLSVAVVLVHWLFLAGVVVFAHHPPIFMGFLLFFLGFTTAYQSHQTPLILRESLLVAFFLAGLVVLGGLQQWWLQPILLGMDATTVFFVATALTAITDNAALTYLASLVPGLSPEFQVALVAGAVTGGGLTVIANAPNPAGVSILRGSFKHHAIHPMGLLIAALPPTWVAMLAFRVL